ncbi:hypothetical protein ACVW1C_000972 [Bradyrhizobium sp. USDA 4011]
MSKLSIPKLVKAETQVAHIKQLTTRMVTRSEWSGAPAARRSQPPLASATLRIVTGKTGMKGTTK